MRIVPPLAAVHGVVQLDEGVYCPYVAEIAGGNRIRKLEDPADEPLEKEYQRMLSPIEEYEIEATVDWMANIAQ